MGERKVRIGMVGAGFIGQLGHLMNYVEVKNCDIVALAEFRPELRKKMAARYSIPKTYSTHHELLKDPDVDAVIVVTPRSQTAPVVFDCLNAGKHVMSEKPMAGTSDQATRLVALAECRNLHYAVGYMKRYDEGVQLAKQIYTDAMKSGELGAVLFARAHCYMGDSYCNADGHLVSAEKADYADTGWPTAPDWLPVNWHQPFASFANTYSHNVNLLRHLFEKSPTVSYASLASGNGQISVFDFGSFKASLETGRATNRGWDELTEIYFEHGRLSIRTPPALLKNVPASVELYKAGKVQQVITHQSNWTWAFRRQAQAFVDDILENRDSISSGADSVEDLRVIESMWRLQMEAA